MSNNIEYLRKIVENVGRIVDHPGNLGKCQLCVQIDVISGLPVFYYSRVLQQQEHIKLEPQVVQQQEEQSAIEESIVKAQVVSDKGIFDDITFVGGDNDDSEESEDYAHEAPVHPIQLGYAATRPDDNLITHEIIDGDERTEESGYYSYETYEDTDEESYESAPKKRNDSQKKRNEPPSTHVVEKKQTPAPVPIPPKPVIKQPVFVSYNDDSIYKTSNGEYVKLTGTKYLNESVEFLDKLAVKMFEKTFGPDYKEMKKYTDMQTRYAGLYGASAPPATRASPWTQ